MEMTGCQRLPAPREAVWAALNDPEVLRACIAGCETMSRAGEQEFVAAVHARIGPVQARFVGKVLLADLDPPHGYTLRGEGSGGAAGFVNGSATVRLTPAEDALPGQPATVLSYTVQAQVGGKLAQLGSRLIDGTARKLADDFFARFGAQFDAAPEPAAAGPNYEPATAGLQAEPAAGADLEEGDALPAAPRPEQPALLVWSAVLLAAAAVALALLINA